MGFIVERQSLVGVWKRQSIQWPDGSEDRSTKVCWVQSNPHYADLRIPHNRPSFAGIENPQDCNPDQKKWLASAQGFAGKLCEKDGAWIWEREIDYQPPTGRRDIGRLQFLDAAGQIMREEGIDEAYTEIWERIDDGKSTGGEGFVAKFREGGESGQIVAVGKHFIFARRDSQGVEISHGIPAGKISDWIVTESTRPWREGETIFARFNSRVNWEIVEAGNRAITT
jgi:hypothetical protein